MKFHVSRQARLAIDEIFWTIAAEKPSAARRWLSDLDKLIDRLETFPHSGRIVPEYGIEELREGLLGDYRVVYFVGPTQLTLANVIHGARLLKLARDVHQALNEDE